MKREVARQLHTACLVLNKSCLFLLQLNLQEMYGLDAMRDVKVFPNVLQKDCSCCYQHLAATVEDV